MEVRAELQAPAALTSGKQPPYILDIRLVGLEIRCGHSGGKKVFLPISGIELRFLNHITRSLECQMHHILPRGWIKWRRF